MVYFESSNLEREKASQGKYLIRTEEQGLTPVDAVAAYKELSEVERAFRHLKIVIELRPIYHRRDQRVRGHIFIASLVIEARFGEKAQRCGLGTIGKGSIRSPQDHPQSGAGSGVKAQARGDRRDPPPGLEPA